MELKDYIAILRRRWLSIAVTFFALGAVFGAYLFMREVPTYTATTRIGVRTDPKAITPAELSFVQFDAAGGLNFYTKEALVSSKQVFEMAALLYLAARDQKDLKDPREGRKLWRDRQREYRIAQWIKDRDLANVVEVSEGQIDDLIPKESEAINAAFSMLQGSIAITRPDEKVQLMTLNATARTADEAILMANAYAKAAEIYSRVESRRYLNTALRQIERKKGEVNDQRLPLQTTLGPSEDLIRRNDREMQAISEHARSIEKEIEQTIAKRERQMVRVRNLSAYGHEGREAVPDLPEDDTLNSPLLERIRGDMVTIGLELSTGAWRWTREHPQLLQGTVRLRQLHEEYQAELRRVIAATIRKLVDEDKELESSIAALQEQRQRRTMEMEMVQNQISLLEPDRKKLEGLNADYSKFNDLATRIQSSLALQQGYYSFEDAADRASGAPAKWPQSATILSVLALILAIAVGYLMEYIDSNIYTDYDLRRHLNMPCITIVQDLGRTDPLILRTSPRDPFSERFNIAATIIRSYLDERQFKSVTVCSAIPQEGKTMVSVNLSIALARKGLKVALIDCDLRIPQVHRIFNMENSRGLSTILSGDGTEAADPEPQMAITEVENLRVLPSGPIPENPVVLLESKNMVTLIKALREKLDVVIFDSPPITSVGDTLTLARLVDTNVFVVGAGLSNRRIVTWAKQLLGNVRADICGAILNFARRQTGSQYYYYYYTKRG